MAEKNVSEVALSKQLPLPLMLRKTRWLAKMFL